jgi:hypothetical protein
MIEIVRKPVAFNIADPDQARMLEHAARRPNFSGYIKRLIQRDMEGGHSPARETSQEPGDADFMQGLI